MKAYSSLAALCALLVAPAVQSSQFGPVFYGDAPDEHHPWAVHDGNRPQPKIITPGTFSSQEQPGKPPSDAIVLFDGTDLSKWEADSGAGGPTKWIINNGAMECVPGSGYIRTKDKFGDCQFHIEWAAPTKAEGSSQGRGNSGVFLMGLIEIQVLDNYNNPTYADGMAGSVYSDMPPLVNALRPPGQFQVYDIIFRRPIYKDGKAVDPGYVTVFLNGVVVQDHTMLEGGTGHMGRSKIGPLPEKGPLKFQDHGNPVRFRNVWYRELPPRITEGSTDGYLSVEATMAKRKEIAATIRADAAKLAAPGNPLPELLRLAESLEYEQEAAALQKVGELTTQYLANLNKLPEDKVASKKDEAKNVAGAFKFLARFKAIPADFAPKAELDKFIKDHGFDKK